jgi:hypothetical protein
MLMLGALIVAVEKLTLFKPNAVPVGVTNSVELVDNNGLISKLVVLFTAKEHSIRAIVPFLYSATGA